MAISNSITQLGIRELATATVVAIIYAGMSVLFNDNVDILFQTQLGDGRPALFLLAVVAIYYGPMIGGFSAAFGNLLYDLIQGPLLNGTTLDVSNFGGFIANLLGGFVVGIFARSYEGNESIFTIRKNLPANILKIFDRNFFRRLFRNIMASIFGFAFIVPLIISYGKQLTPSLSTAEFFPLFASTAWANGIYLLISVPLSVIAVALFDYLSDKATTKRLAKRRVFTFPDHSDTDFELSASSPEGEELIIEDWGAVEFCIKNISAESKVFFVRISSNDIFSPHLHKTPKLGPNETDNMFFSVYPVSEGSKQASVYVSNSLSEQQKILPFRYIVEGSNLMEKLVGIFLIIGVFSTVVLIYGEIVRQAKLDAPTIISLIAVPIEILLVWALYKLREMKIVKHLFGDYKEKNFHQHLFGEVDVDYRNQQRTKVGKYEAISKTFYSIAAGIFLLSWGILIYRQYFAPNFNLLSNFVLYSIALLFVFAFISQYFNEKVQKIIDEIEQEKSYENQSIKSAFTTHPIIKYKTSKIKLRIANPFRSKGMRIYFHTLDHMTPLDAVFPNVKTNEIVEHEFDFTPLADGARKIAVEFVQYRSHGDILPPEEAETYDQESLLFHASSTIILGLSPTQISIIRKLIAGVGALSLSVSLIARIFGIVLDATIIDSTIPIVVLLQAPAIWLFLYFQNKLGGEFIAEE